LVSDTVTTITSMRQSEMGEILSQQKREWLENWIPEPAIYGLSFEGIPENFLLPDRCPDYFGLIIASRVYGITKETPLTSAVNMSAKLGVRVVMKREDLQPVLSFKIRGAYNKMAHIPEEEQWKGVITCSGGSIP
jgi:hypothetical protein